MVDKKIKETIDDVESGQPSFFTEQIDESELSDIEEMFSGKYKRPSFRCLTDKFEKTKPKSKKNKRYFYIEYYDDVERWSELVETLKSLGLMKTNHEINPCFFYELISVHIKELIKSGAKFDKGAQQEMFSSL